MKEELWLLFETLTDPCCTLSWIRRFSEKRKYSTHFRRKLRQEQIYFDDEKHLYMASDIRQEGVKENWCCRENEEKMRRNYTKSIRRIHFTRERETEILDGNNVRTVVTDKWPTIDFPKCSFTKQMLQQQTNQRHLKLSRVNWKQLNLISIDIRNPKYLNLKKKIRFLGLN